MKFERRIGSWSGIHPMLIVSSEGGIEYANEKAGQLLGYGADSLTHFKVQDLVPVAARAAHRVAMEGFMAAPTHRRMGTGRELAVLHRSGAEIPVEIVLEPIRVGDRYYILSTLIDIRERESIERQLRQAARMASIGLAAAGVAHELNNPLAFVLTNVEASLQMLDGVGTESAPVPCLAELREALVESRDGARRMRAIIEALLTTAREPATTKDGSTADLRVVLHAALRTLAHEIGDGIDVRCDLDDVPPVVGEQAQLIQVFTNLIVNAAQAIGRAAVPGGRVVVRAYVDEEDWVVVEVLDNGPGVPAHVVDRIGEPFITSRADDGGTGLGVFICRRITHSFGGEMRIATRPEVDGTRVRVRLRVGDRLASERPGSSRPRDALLARILIVDDEPLMRSALRRLLSRDYEVAEASSALEALELLRAHERFDVILSDVRMADMGGAEFLRRLTSDWPDVVRRTLFMTGDIAGVAAEFRDSLENALIQKPVDAQVLRAALRDVVASNRDQPRRSP